MRESLKKLQRKITFYGYGHEEKDLELRGILQEILELIDQALPKEVEPEL